MFDSHHHPLPVFVCVSVRLSLAAAVQKLDPEDGEKVFEYLKTHVLLAREKSRKCKCSKTTPNRSVFHGAPVWTGHRRRVGLCFSAAGVSQRPEEAAGGKRQTEE